MDKMRAHIIIEGMVQGVWYRAFTRDTASSLGLTGWVRNLPDSRVEAVFEGSRQDIEKAIQDCHHGPSGARVTNISASWEAFTAEFSNFEIRY